MASELEAPRQGRLLRITCIIACAVFAVAAVVALVMRSAEQSANKQELFWGGPLSFDMVHTHILNMKMRRSRLKERLKEAALKRKDRELAHEHGFNNQGSIAQPPQSPQLQQAPPQQFQQQPMAYQQPPQYQQFAQAPPPQAYQPYPQANYQQPEYPQYQQAAPMQMAPQQYPTAFQQAPQEAPQLAQQPMYQPQQAAANPWGGATYNAAQYGQVAPSGPTESSEDDKDQQRAQAAASIQAYEAFMHGQAPAPAAAK